MIGPLILSMLLAGSSSLLAVTIGGWAWWSAALLYPLVGVLTLLLLVSISIARSEMMRDQNAESDPSIA
ncbi:hypothetical protein [Celeribacter arenosi]|uniref:Uncharacterized protein n=1 Tax=Celeribacter arenosi TaxID=792649 RepID=A0ABP7K6B3_9RHOB